MSLSDRDDSDREPRDPSVFVAHRPQDRAAAAKLATRLRTKYGIDAWHEDWEIVGGDNEVAKLEDGLRRTDGSVLYLGTAGREDGWAQEGKWEAVYSASIKRAIEGRRSSRPAFLIPVLQDGLAPDALTRCCIHVSPSAKRRSRNWQPRSTTTRATRRPRPR
jgi:TIR domain